uniref:Cardiomyopathy-associated protein 5 n=1 Tax=Davidia involucrata TaxID=16924 RepID=A0A5B7BJJ1_DAVIN
MGLDAKDIQVCIWRILKVSMKFFYSCVRKYPIVSGILLFFFLLYIFLPTVFSFLIYSSPVLVFSAVFLRVYFGLDPQNIKNIKGDEKRNVVIVDKNENSSIQSQTGRRRNVKEKNKEVYVQNPKGVEEKDMVFSTTCSDALVDKTSLIEENPKEIREVKVDSVTHHHAESSSAASQRSEEMSQKFNGGGSEVEAESSEEEAQEDGNKAVEWTEDDQKNLMDLGISEIERNRRLESLIAKRRARKLLSMQVRRTLMNLGNNDPRGQIASILIPRPNPFLPNNSGEAQVSPIPGSAPSVLLPMHNPFDLPYEPQEEKPNLTGGSFQQEFMASQQKDMLFCRHESFCLGPSFPGEFKQDPRETYCYPNFATRHRAPEIPEYSRLKNQPGKEDTNKIIERESSQGDTMLHIGSAHRKQGQATEQMFNVVDISHEGDKSAVQTKPKLVKDVNGGSSSSFSSEVNEPFFNANKDEVIKSIAFEVPKNIAADREDNGRMNELLFDSRPSVFESTRMEERFFYPDKGVHHTPTHSIASDLQVEVSEVSSPPLTNDGINSPSDGEWPMYDMDVDAEKDQTTPGSEEMWVASSHLSGVEENESRSGEVHEVSEQDIMEVGFSRINKKSNGPIASDMLPENVVQQDSSGTSSLLSSKTELFEESQAHSTDFIPKFDDEVQLPRISNSTDILSPENLDLPVLEEAQQSTEKLVAQPSYDSGSEKPEEPSYAEVNIIYNINDPVVCANGEDPILIKQEAARDLLVPTKEDNSTSVGIIEEKCEKPGNDHSKSTECSEDKFENQSEHKHTAEKSESIEDKRMEDSEVEQGVVEVGFSGANKNSNDPVAFAVLPEVVIQQVPTDPSSSSPDSLLQEKDLEPSSPPEKSTKDSKLICNVNDSEVSANNDMEGLKTINEIDSEACISIKRENAGDLSKPSEETISESIACIEDQSEIPGEHQTILESYKPVEENDNLKSLKDFEGDIQKLAEQEDAAEKSKPIEDTDIRESIQYREGGQSIVELESYADSQSFNDPIALDVLPELVIEQVPVASSSSSSPKSVLQNKFSMDQASSLNFDQETHIEVQQSVREVVGNNSSDELLPETSTVTSPQNELHLMEDSTAHQSIDRDFENFQESTNLSTKSTEGFNTVYIVNDNKGKENSDSTEDIEGESQTFSSHEATADLLKAAGETDSRSNKDNEGMSGKLTEYEAAIGPSKVADQSNISNILANKKEELSNPSGKSTEEANINYNVNELVISEQEEALNSKSVRDGESEPQLLMKQEIFEDSMKPSDVISSKSMEDTEGELKKLAEDEALTGQSIPMEENENSDIIRDIEEVEKSVECEDVISSPKPAAINENLEAIEIVEDESRNLTTYEDIVDKSKPADDSNIPVTSAEIEEPSNPPPGRPIEEANIISNVDESPRLKVSEKVDFKSVVGDIEGQSPRLIIPATVVEPSKNVEVANLRSIEDTEGKYKELTEVEAMVVSPEPAVKSDNLNNIKDTEEFEKLIDHEIVIDQGKPGQGDDSLSDIEDRKGESIDKSVNHNTVMELPRPMESGGKVHDA